MTVAVCHVMPALDVAAPHTRMPALDVAPPHTRMPALDVAPPHTRMPAPMPPPEQLDMWGAINGCATKPEPPAVKPKNGYPMATVRRSMSQESLSICTESLGCETGTRGDFLDLASLLYAPPTTDDADLFSPPALQEDNEEEEEVMGEVILREVQYHRARPQRAFPPPLPSMSRRGGDDAGPCLRVRPHRRDGRLVLEAVAAKPHGYLHAQREGGRLKLCFVDCSSVRGHQRQSTVQPQHEHQKQSMVAASGKAQRCSRIVINKFVGGAPATTDDLNAIPSPSRGSRAAEEEAAQPATPGLRRVPSSTTTLAAAVAAASTGMQSGEEDEEEVEEEAESAPLLFTSRVGDREELVQSVRRCRQLRQRPLFIVEPYSIVAA